MCQTGTRRHTVWTEPLEFGKLTWPEVARASGEERVPIVPIGTLEDHGYHLPIDTDVTLVEAVCRGAAERLPAQTVLLPPIVHGYSPHHMDFPGTVSIRWDSTIACATGEPAVVLDGGQSCTPSTTTSGAACATIRTIPATTDSTSVP